MEKNTERTEHVEWGDLLYAYPTMDGIVQDKPYEEQLRRAAQMLKDADMILIGAGAGLSTAAGLTFGGKRFEDNFGEFIEKYGIADMYTGGFYPFPSEEARWGFWSKQVMVNKVLTPGLPLYKELLEMVEDKDYFVITTNIDEQFCKSGFAPERIFATQGDYSAIQCAKGCDETVYKSEELMRKMDVLRKDCLIPSELVPKCPTCGGPMDMHLRCDFYFVEDEAWQECADRYAAFLERMKGKKTVLLELGVGYNTPIIIRFPFDKFAKDDENFRLIRMNLEDPAVSEALGDRAVSIGGDTAEALRDIRKLLQE